VPAHVQLGGRAVGAVHPVWVVAEIGINHDGSVEVAKELIDGAKRAGCDAVKLQKRTPERCVPRDQWHVERDTPWGRLTYIEYRHKIELSADQYAEIDAHCRARDIAWFVSCWDEESVDFIERFDVPCHKAASASLTDHALLRAMRSTARPLVISTGMSTMAEIEAAVAVVGQDELLIAHSTSAYPCDPRDLNLRMIPELARRFPACPIGYSGHERDLAPTVAAVALGATFVERHVTLDRTRWGSDHSASLDLCDLERLVSQIRDVEHALGDGVKRVYSRELPHRAKLRRVASVEPAVPDGEPASR
jgi:N-acetylneuraminate synthase